MHRITQEFRLESGYYAEALQAGKRSNQIAFNWSVGVHLSALAASAKSDSSHRAELIRFADLAQTYWNPLGPVPGYDVLPAPKPVDRYYDDNAWMVLALVETYKVTGETRFLDRAEASLKYVLSGEDDVLGGGIYWRESDKATKNTCSNAPSAAACLAMAKYRNRETYREKAEALYVWCQKNLQDPNDKLYWDNIDRSGKIEKTKWSYNSALMLRVARELGRPEALSLAKACAKRWVNPSTGVIEDEAQFAHLLFENLLPYESELKLNLARGLSAVKPGPDGWYGKRWSANSESVSPQRRELIHQVSFARAFYVAQNRG